MKTFLARLCLTASLAVMFLAAIGKGHAQANTSYELGERDAQQFAYGYGGVAGAHIAVGFTGTGTQTALVCPAIRTTADGRQVNLFSAGPATPVSFDTGLATAETVTPTSVSLVAAPSGEEASQQCAQITGSFTFAHAASQNVYQVRSGTFGLQEAINDAAAAGGSVTVGTNWGGTEAMLTAATPFWNVNIIDKRKGIPVVWSPVGGATTLAAPATLTAVTALPSATPAGSYTTGTYHLLIACVDIMGQEGPASADFSEAGLATGSFVFSAPAAQTGCVGYTPYIGLTGGAAGTVYKVPLVTQPTVVGAFPVSNGVCTLTNVETITPACAVANTTYGQTGSAATVTALTLNTSPIAPQVTTVSTTSIYVPNAGGRTTYAYSPGAHTGVAGTITTALPFTISAADATVVPSVIGTINIRPGFMNHAGQTIEVCGYATTTASTGTIKDIQFQWDAFGQNTAGKGVQIGDLTVTQTSTSVTQLDFCEKFETTVTSASATGGSIQTVGGYVTSTIASLSAAAAGGNTQAGAIGSLNLAGEARLNIIYLHTTGTDGTAVTLQGVTVRVI
jgi:hypothetical protein